MKIISLNLHGHQEKDEITKLNRICEYILSNNIDVCLLQEVSQKLDSKNLIDNIKEDNNAYYIAKKIGYNYVYKGFKVSFDVYEEGLAILAKKPIKNVRLVNISKTDSYNSWLRRCALCGEIDSITFIDTHLGWDIDDEKFENQFNNIVPVIQKRTILAGDFNFPDNTKEIKLVKNILKSAHDELKVDSKINPTFHFELDSKYVADNRMIDYIFTSDDIKVIDYKIALNTLETYVSDHSLVQVEII